MSWCIRELKWLIFHIDGKCKNQGYCCEFIQIRFNNKPIDSMDMFNVICNQNKKMTRFQPIITNKKINYFNCNCLTDNRLCSDYETRPQFCVDYPYSILLSDARLHKDCGYSVIQKYKLPFYTSNHIQRSIAIFKYNLSK